MSVATLFSLCSVSSAIPRSTKGLCLHCRFVGGRAVHPYARQFGDIGDPAPLRFAERIFNSRDRNEPPGVSTFFKPLQPEPGPER